MKLQRDPAVKLFATEKTARTYATRHNLDNAIVEPFGAAFALKCDQCYVRRDGTLRS